MMFDFVKAVEGKEPVRLIGLVWPHNTDDDGVMAGSTTFLIEAVGAVTFQRPWPESEHFVTGFGAWVAEAHGQAIRLYAAQPPSKTLVEGGED